MAVYIIMVKEYEDENKVIYNYGPNEKQMGKVGLDKVKQTLLDLESVNDGVQNNSFYFKRAAQRLAVVSRDSEKGFEDRIVISS